MKKIAMMMVAAMAMAAAFAIDTSIAYQGVLRDENGNALSTKNKTVEFRLYTVATGGTALWGRSIAVLLDDTGLFTTELSDTTGNALTGVTYSTLVDALKAARDASTLYVGLKVTDSSGEITPRQKIIMTPYSSYAADVTQATGNFTVSGTATLNGNATVGGTLTAKNVNVTGATTFGGATTFNGNVTVKNTGTMTLGKDATVSGTFTANDATVNGTATFNGAATFNKATQFKNSVSVSGTISGYGTIPVGGIIMWSGTTPPDGWALCDGQTSNGYTTPNLSGRFIVAAGADPYGYTYYYVGSTGGETKHRLTWNEMPSHSHTRTMRVCGLDASTNGDTDFFAPSWKRQNSTEEIRTDSAGGDQVHENRPCYYALAFIMRVK